MATAMSRRNTKKAKALDTAALIELIKQLQVAIPEAVSLLSCAQAESKKRHKQIHNKKSLQEKWTKESDDGDQPECVTIAQSNT